MSCQRKDDGYRFWMTRDSVVVAYPETSISGLAGEPLEELRHHRVVLPDNFAPLGPIAA